MKFSFGMKKNFDLGKIKLELSEEINDIAGMVVKDHKDRLDSGMDIHGKPFKKLRPNTIAQKSAKGYKDPRKVLVATGTMQKFPPFKKATPASQQAIIKPAQSRMKIGAYHQGGTSPYTIKPKSAKKLVFTTLSGKVFTDKVNHPGLDKREWYGVSDRIADKGFKFIVKEIDRRLKRA